MSLSEVVARRASSAGNQRMEGSRMTKGEAGKSGWRAMSEFLSRRRGDAEVRGRRRRRGFLSRRRGGAEGERGIFEAVDGTEYAVFHPSGTEVEEVPKLKASEAEIGLDLLAVGVVEGFDGLQLDDHFAFDQEVSAEGFVEGHGFVDDLDGDLALGAQTFRG